MEYYQGARYQRGAGLGSIFGGLIRSAAPMVMRGLKTVGKEALQGGMNVLGDVVQGKRSLKQAAKRRLVQGASNLVNDALLPQQKKKRPSSTGAPRPGPIKRRRAPDIFQ